MADETQQETPEFTPDVQDGMPPAPTEDAAALPDDSDTLWIIGEDGKRVPIAEYQKRDEPEESYILVGDKRMTMTEFREGGY